MSYDKRAGIFFLVLILAAFALAQVPSGGSGLLTATVGQFCGATSACAATNITPTMKIVTGSAPLVSGTPSAVTIAGISPAFTSTATFNCTASDNTTQANSVLVTKVSGSSITLTGIATNTDTVSYICVGN